MKAKRLYDPKPPEPNRFSRRWWMDRARMALWVSVVTALIWVYADMEFIDKQRFSATIRLVAGDPQSRAIIENEGQERRWQDVKIAFSATGSRSNLDRLRNRLVAGAQLQYDVSQDYPAGTHAVPTAEILRAATRLDELGAAVETTDPQTVEVELDDVVHEILPLHLQYEGATLDPKPAPQMVGIRLARSRWKALMAEVPENRRRLRTQPVNLSNRRPGEEASVEARVIPEVAGRSVRLDRATATFRVQLAEQAAAPVITRTLDMDVRVQFPPEWATPDNDFWRRYRFEARDPRWYEKTFTLRGPEDQVEDLLQRKDALIREGALDAYILLEEGDRRPTEAWYTKNVQLRLPPQYRDVKLTQPETVEFKLVERPGG